jgi:hypothetical protein
MAVVQATPVTQQDSHGGDEDSFGPQSIAKLEVSELTFSHSLSRACRVVVSVLVMLRSYQRLATTQSNL